MNEFVKPPVPVSTLVVDDDRDLLTLMETVVNTAGGETTCTQSPLEALELLKKSIEQGTPFDIVFVDIMMPKLNGNELTAKIRESGYKGAVIAFTSSVTGLGRKASKEAGIDHYLDKMTLKVDLIRALFDQYVPDKSA